MPRVSAKLASQTKNVDIKFQKYNIFVDTSSKATEAKLQQDSATLSPAPSAQDVTDFAQLQPKYVLFNGEAGLQATRQQMTTVQYPFESDKLWDKKTLLSQWTIGFWFMIPGAVPWHDDDLAADDYERSRVQTLLELEMMSLEG